MDGYECVCETGWEGHSCHQEVDECVSSPCQNGAQCTVSIIMSIHIILYRGGGDIG